MKKMISLFVFSLLIWLLLAGYELEEILLGILVSLIVALVFRNTTAIRFGPDIFGRALIFIFVYLPVFLWQLVKANIDVARRVLSPKIPVDPGFVKVPTAIKSEAGRLILANSITLTPGTISVDVDDDNIYVHWIDVKKKDENILTEKISGAFEKVLRRIFK